MNKNANKSKNSKNPEYYKKYYKNNKEKIAERQKRYYEKNKEKLANPELYARKPKKTGSAINVERKTTLKEECDKMGINLKVDGNEPITPEERAYFKKHSCKSNARWKNLAKAVSKAGGSPPPHQETALTFMKTK